MGGAVKLRAASGITWCTTLWQVNILALQPFTERDSSGRVGRNPASSRYFPPRQKFRFGRR